MSFHVIVDDGIPYVGPSDYERGDQAKALALFKDVSDAFSLCPNNQAGVVDYLLRRMPEPRRNDAEYARDEQERHFTHLYRAFKSSYASHARSQQAPKAPPQKITEPTPLPENLIPGQRKEMVDPDTGEVKVVIVPPETPGPGKTPQVDVVAVQINGARTFCFEELGRSNRQTKVLEASLERDDMAEALRREKETKNQLKELGRNMVRVRGYYDVLQLVAEAHPRHPGVQSIEHIVRAEKIDLQPFGLNYKKLREFVADFAPQATA